MTKPIPAEPWLTLNILSAEFAAKQKQYRERIKRTPIIDRRKILGGKIRGIGECVYAIKAEIAKCKKDD